MKKRILLQIEENKDNSLSFQSSKLTTLEILGLVQFLKEIKNELLKKVWMN